VRLAILTFESPQANYIIQRVLTERPHEVCGIVRSTALLAGKSLRQSIWFVLRRTSVGFAVRKGAEIALARVAAMASFPIGPARRSPTLRRMTADAGVPLIDARDINASQVVETLQAWRPDLLVSVYLNQRIGSRLIELFPERVVNVHGASLPGNRGLFPYFWALANGDTDGGATVHWIDEDFDTGDVLLKKRFPIAPDDSVTSLAWKSTRVGADLLLEAIRLIEAGNPPRRVQDRREGRYFSWPTAADVRRLKRRGRRFCTQTRATDDVC
jgi:methionyl-tRNA formyltransferase